MSKVIEIPSKLDESKLAGTGFLLGEEKILPAVVIAVAGLEGQGKTHLAFSAAAQGDTAYMYTDRRHDGVIQKFYGLPGYGRILPSEYGYKIPKGLGVAATKGKSQDEIAALMTADLLASVRELEGIIERFIRDYQAAMRAGFRNILWDTESELWELFRASRFLRRYGRMEKVPGLAYGELNAEFRGLIREAKQYGCNLVLLRKLKKEYSGENWNGGYYPAGFGDTGFLADIAVRMRYDVENKTFFAKITKSGVHPELTGLEIPDPTFTGLVRLCVPEADWKPEPGEGDGSSLDIAI